MACCSWLALRRAAREEVEAALAWARSDPAAKSTAHTCLVLAPGTSAFLSRLIDMQELQHHGVTDLTELSGDDAAADTALSSVQSRRHRLLYILSDSVDSLRRCCFHARRLFAAVPPASDAPPPVFFAFCGSMSASSSAELERLGMFGRVNVRNMPAMALKMLDADVASMEDSTAFADAFLHRGLAVVDAVATSLLHLQRLYGPFGVVSGKGKVSARVCDVLRQCYESGEVAADAGAHGSEPRESGRIGRVLIVDRTLDMLTPMMTQLSYEGILDELVTISAGYASIGGIVEENDDDGVHGDDTDNANRSMKRNRFPLFDSDPLFRDLRDQNFVKVLDGFKNRAESIRAKLDEHNNAHSVAELRDFVKNLPSYLDERNSLRVHMKLAKTVKTATEKPEFLRVLRSERSLLEGQNLNATLDSIEYAIVRQVPWTEPMRLLCLWSGVAGGLKDKDYDTMCRFMVHSYGPELVLPLITRLKRLGLMHRFRHSTHHTDFRSLRRSLDLIVDEVREDDASHALHRLYSFSGYAPALVRIIERMLETKSWNQVDAVIPVAEQPSRTFRQKGRAATKPIGGDGTLVFVVGGITRSEVSALRILRRSSPASPFAGLVIASTGIITGTSLLRSLVL